jgi:cyclophilin family peptidyl-prolyl cis-trans isomerase
MKLSFRSLVLTLTLASLYLPTGATPDGVWAQESTQSESPQSAESKEPPAESGGPSTDSSVSANASGNGTAVETKDGANPAVPGSDAATNPDVEFYESLKKQLKEDPEFKADFDRIMKEYEQAKVELQEAISKQRATYLRYQNGDATSPGDLVQYRKERRATEIAMDKLYIAALSWMRISGNQDAIQYVLTMIGNREQNDIYDGETLLGAVDFINGGRNELYFYLAAFRSAVVVGDTEVAESIFKRIDPDLFTDADKRISHDLKRIQSDYEAETKRYAEDAKHDLPRVKFETTAGDFTVELFLKDAPSTVSNFIGLVEQGFYDGLDFIQVVDHMLALTGDPSSTGTGNSGNFLVDENQGEDIKRHALRGSLVMAKIPMEKGKFIPNSASSQFAILYLPAPYVPQSQTVFGRVIEGMDVVSRLQRVDPNEKKSKDKVEIPPDRILTATVIRRPEILPQPKYVYESKPTTGLQKQTQPAKSPPSE